MIIFYSNNCPRCKVLESKLKKKGIEYVEVNDIEAMINAGLKSAPALRVEGELLDFAAANKWINAQEGTSE